MTSNPQSEELSPPAAADRGSGVRSAQSQAISIISRRGMSTDPLDRSVRKSGAIPVARFAKDSGVDRQLAGDGGDELSAGNPRYVDQQVFEWSLCAPALLRCRGGKPRMLSVVVH